ncbi:hypothetical protein H6F94_09170 [Leptolyngbya sp. FACHB-261]|nr:hypothetical protein [Leptolyngbya sp. FACHB-261]
MTLQLNDKGVTSATLDQEDQSQKSPHKNKLGRNAFIAGAMMGLVRLAVMGVLAYSSWGVNQAQKQTAPSDTSSSPAQVAPQVGALAEGEK